MISYVVVAKTRYLEVEDVFRLQVLVDVLDSREQRHFSPGNRRQNVPAQIQFGVVYLRETTLTINTMQTV